MRPTKLHVLQGGNVSCLDAPHPHGRLASLIDPMTI